MTLELAPTPLANPPALKDGASHFRCRSNGPRVSLRLSHSRYNIPSLDKRQ